MEFAIFCKITVFPVLGGATIKDLCPFPIGETKSITLAVTSVFFSIFVFSISNLIFSSGYNGVRLSKLILCLFFQGFQN